MTAFALVHGAWHGAWCWDRLVLELGARGHDVIAVHLPCDDPAAGLEACADEVAEATDDFDAPIVVVGHSLGGLTIPLVPSRRPVSTLVYLDAFLPVEGQSMADQFATSPEPVLLIDGGRDIDDLGRSSWVDEATAAAILYPDLEPADVAWAFPRLRAQSRAQSLDVSPVGAAPVRAVSLVGAEDRVTNPAWSRRVARERLGSDPTVLPGGHFPMITHPSVLADALVEAAA